MEIEIEIIVKDKNDIVIVKSSARTFEGAEEELGKLERYIEKKRGLKRGEEYPYGDMVEPYDIEREKDLLRHKK